MILLYLIAFLALAFVGYLIHDFYNEQLRERLIPVRADKKRAFRKDYNRLPW